MVDWESFYAAFRRPGFVPGYEIHNHLGGGAFGEVYKACKTSIGKAYAIKFLRLDEDSQRDAVDRELDQVRLFASIDHPNLVTIEDMGVVEGVPYLIMGYAGEDTLARRLKGGDLESARALRYFVQACRGVLALHDRRLAHFDLKPSNIFLRGDVARVGDYGLAKLLVEGRQTLSFGRGTPHYMAPEMMKNRADHRADIYSLGVILYESLAFELPFGADGTLGMVVREEDDPPEFPEGFPEHLRPVVTRCLRLEPDDRYDTVHDLLAALGQPSRQGDSVRVRGKDLPAATRELQSRGPAPEPSAEGDPDSKPGEDLKVAAQELARGAVGVARGVWDGVRDRVSKASRAEEEKAGTSLEKARERIDRAAASVSAKLSEAAEQLVPSGIPDDEEPGPASGDDDSKIGGDVVHVSTLDDPDDPSAEELQETAALSPPDAPWRLELERAREEKRRARDPGLLAVASAAPAPLVSGTVPVPPRAEGGWFGNVVQSAVVGGEIMGALVTGPFLVSLRGTATLFDRVLRGVPGLIGRILRLIMMLVLMALLGGLVALAFLAALSLTP
jgi:tRNA A-37 threonylcarbamoyl transferase component Bud32